MRKSVVKLVLGHFLAPRDSTVKGLAQVVPACRISSYNDPWPVLPRLAPRRRPPDRSPPRGLSSHLIAIDWFSKDVVGVQFSDDRRTPIAGPAFVTGDGDRRVDRRLLRLGSAMRRDPRPALPKRKPRRAEPTAPSKTQVVEASNATNPAASCHAGGSFSGREFAGRECSDSRREQTSQCGAPHEHAGDFASGGGSIDSASNRESIGRIVDG